MLCATCKFCWNLLSGSGEEDKMLKMFTTTTRTTVTMTTTTDNGQILIRKAHLCLRLRWTYKHEIFSIAIYIHLIMSRLIEHSSTVLQLTKDKKDSIFICSCMGIYLLHSWLCSWAMKYFSLDYLPFTDKLNVRGVLASC